MGGLIPQLDALQRENDLSDQEEAAGKEKPRNLERYAYTVRFAFSSATLFTLHVVGEGGMLRLWRVSRKRQKSAERPDGTCEAATQTMPLVRTSHGRHQGSIITQVHA